MQMDNSNLSKLVFLLILGLVITSCTSKVYKYPYGNLNESQPNANNKTNEVAPTQRTQELDICNAFDREHSTDDFSSISMSPSSSYIKTMFPVSNFNKDIVDYLTQNIESIVFTGIDKGYAAFSHPISFDLAKNLNLPFSNESKNVGGTDLFEFYTTGPGKFEFKNLDTPINSIYWDSHPTALTDTLPDGTCVTLLIWSSDRNLPFTERINLKGEKLKGGNTDLFYAFRLSDGSWTDVKTFDNKVNTDANEGTPFIYCSCCNPYLLFSSDRSKTELGDYDIFYTKLQIDYHKFEITALEESQLLGQKANENRADINTINSHSDDRFPFAPLPHGESSPNVLYLSSARYDKNSDKGRKFSGTIVQNAGGYDIYKFPLPDFLICPSPEPPEVQLHVALINLANPDEPVKMPVLYLHDYKSEENQFIEQNTAIFKIKAGKRYDVSGGSYFNQIDCEADPIKVMSGYLVPEDTIITLGRETSVEKRTIRDLKVSFSEYDLLPKVKYDTSYSEKTVLDRAVEVRIVKSNTVVNPRLAGNLMEYDLEIVTTSSWDKLRKVSHKNLAKIPHQKISGAHAISEQAKNGGWKVPLSVGYDLIVYDTVYVLPDYFVKPPCYCEFTEFMTGYEQNVPYYQTGFWEINTLSNFRRDLNRLGRREFSEAKWIELHKNNQYFSSSPERRQSRIFEYEKFAKVVDKNLDMMADIINRRIIPAFQIVENISKNEKLIISLDAWSDKRPVRRGWYIGDQVEYFEGALNESAPGYDINFQKVSIKSGDLLNLNNDTLSKLRAYYGYKELITRLLNKEKFGSAFYEYFKQGKVLLPDNRSGSSDKSDIDGFSPQTKIEDAKIIFLIKGNYFDPTEFKIPQYIRNVDSSLYMLDTIRRIDLRVNNLYYNDGRFIESQCCNRLLPCLEYDMILSGVSPDTVKSKIVPINKTANRKEKFLLYFGSYSDLSTAQLIMVMLNEIADSEMVIEQTESDGQNRFVVRTTAAFDINEARSKQDTYIKRINISKNEYPEFVIELIQSE